MAPPAGKSERHAGMFLYTPERRDSMCKFIDFKSAIIGGLVVALVICAVGAVHNAPCDEYDRFELVTTTNFALLLDRATGQVWALQIGFADNVIVTPLHPVEDFYAPKTYDIAAEPN
jgi:hypothetical protein